MNTGQLAALNDAGSYLLDRWNVALADYRAQRERFFGWYTAPATDYSKQSARLMAEADALFTRVQSFEIIISKIGAMLQSGTGTWDDIRGLLSRVLPAFSTLREWLGLSGPPAGLGAASAFLSIGGMGVLGAATTAAWYFARRMRNLMDEITAAQVTLQQRQQSGTPPTPQEIDVIMGSAVDRSRPGISIGENFHVPMWALLLMGGVGLVLVLRR